METTAVNLMGTIRSMEAILEVQLKALGVIRIQLDLLLDKIESAKAELDKINPEMKLIREILS